jgi:cytochrome P450
MRVDEKSLLDPEVQEDPYAYYRALREQAPVYRMPDTGAYVLSRYRDVQWALGQHELYSIDLLGKAGFSMFRHPQAREILEREGHPRNTKLSTDPPEHKGYRAIVNASFTAGRVNAQAPFVQSVIDELAGELAARGECEFVRDFAAKLPIRVIAHRLGLPQEDVPALKAWSDAWVEPLSYGCTLEREIEIAWQGVELQRYLARLFEKRRKHPGDDILSDIANGRLPDGRPLSELEAMGIAEHVVVGGHETVSSALAMSLLLLIQHPGVEGELRADPSLVRNFVEEALRLESPSQGFFRYALQDSELHGVRIPAGSMLHLRFAAANRDPEQFADPDRLDLHRPNPGAHLAFGQGMHHCLGAPLARQELNLAFRALLERFEGFRLAPGHGEPRHVPGLSLRSLRELHVRFDPRPARAAA